jgi:hypothetical protein
VCVHTFVFCVCVCVCVLLCVFSLLHVRLCVNRLLDTSEGAAVTGSSVKCGVVHTDTKLIFRSRSARVFWLIQVSEEMWEFADDGLLYYEKAVNTYQLFFSSFLLLFFFLLLLLLAIHSLCSIFQCVF